GERRPHRLDTVLRLRDDPQVRLRVEHLPQARAHDRVVVGDEDAGDQWDRHQEASAGTSSRTSTPPPPPGFTASAPPPGGGASRMPRGPFAPFQGAPSSSPRPSSTTRKTTLAGPRSRVSSTQEASAWRATFVRLSCATR